MNECTYKNYDELPLMLNVVQVAAVLGISRAGAYELVHSEDFPTLKIGSRIVVPKDKLREWIDVLALLLGLLACILRQVPKTTTLVMVCVI